MTPKNTPPQIPPAFQLVFRSVICLTLLSGGVCVSLGTKDSLSSQQIRIFESCNTTWNMGVGAIFGLLGSKADDLFGADDEDDDYE
ncbi:MAG: hypothetical protein EAZ60_08625 [Oscillatoriales cyanobacterium]|nr:MAG: hypothetical protein EAZ83_14360 [Oscillatoriales cyanobacterium]TAE97736.1 MAG: hypothetical protein EAZ79_09945 [Oscillatoriales cyanobacterium]TAF19217.1 MAG: hypothetical protein EAZ73_15950 [Oscillatoriales cyanobacterium]TAF27647.1 MAG: hypothetical protein EAZ69_27825 [Oscillatoriales cyanobacterium]TAF56853.1 MAG: hypothetical protein EAZ60_08625 [Oscillatoriales cyanobacterium]